MTTPRRTPRLVWALVLAATALAPGAARAALPELIGRDVFLGNPVKNQPRIAPYGTQLIFLRPSDDNVLNVWVRTIDRTDDRMITRDMHRGIRTAMWAEDNQHVLFLQDVGGDENFHVYAVDLMRGGDKDLTPHEGVRAQGIQLARDHPGEMLVGMNLRDRKVFDMYRVDLQSGAETLDTQNPGDVGSWYTDTAFVIRAALAGNEKDGSQTLRVRDAASTPWRDLITWPFGETGTFVGFAPDGRSCYVTTSLGADVTRLARVDLSTGRELETLASDPRCDVGTVLLHPVTGALQAVAFNYLRVEWKVLDPAIAPDFAALAAAHAGDFAVVSRDRADATWIVSYTVDDGPLSWMLYDRKTRKATPLFSSQPALEGIRLAKMRPVVIPARDGMKLPGYLTLPVGVAPKHLPMVLNVHGGPWGRDVWGYGGTVQWLANRGYAVLQVNFRASTGLGKAHLNAGNRQWGLTMQDDLTDAVKWAVAGGYADPKRVAIMGGSYGGYATLAGVTFTPDLYACGVDIVGPSNLKTLLAATPAYWAVGRREMILRMGDVETDSVFNRRVSPVFHADRIRVPLLIGQGQNDPRVNVHESEQIVTAMRAHRLPVEYVVYTDEGHGFVRPQNRLDFYGRAEQFLAKHLGGRAEPFAPVEGTSAEVR
jgi:dipeptidyl aminopeptidase/acylaminoacyl peptidase